MDAVVERERSVPVVRNVDVVVLGGGPAGIAAATGAARQGARTVLIERYGFLGGMGTAAMVTNFCGLFGNPNGEKITRIVRGVADDILERISKLGGLNDPQVTHGLTVQAYDTAAYKCAADTLLADAGVEVFFHTLAVGGVRDGGRISAVVVENKSGRAAIAAKQFIDCSGDADLAAWAGAPFEKGNDAGYLAYPTMMFRLGGVDTEVAETEGVPVLKKSALEAVQRRDYSFLRSSPVARPQGHPGEWRMNMTQVSFDGATVDGTNGKHMSRAEVIGRAQVVTALAFLRENIPGFERSFILEIAPQVGIRETRRIVGVHVLTGEEVLSGTLFDDAIGCSGWPVEQHDLGRVRWEMIRSPRGYHQIPYRALIARDVSNLLVAGRCASATQDAQAAVRVSGPCFVMGQAAGIAAALSVETASSVSDLDTKTLQRHLRAQGVYFGD